MFPIRWSTIAMALAAGGLLVSPRPGAAKLVEEITELPVEVANLYGRVFQHSIKVTIFRDDEKHRSPFIVLNHGRAVDAAGRAKLGRARYSDNARYFVARGFAVFVPTRVGYGVSGGDDVEDTGSCEGKNYPPAYEAAAEQSLRVIELAKTLPYVDASRGLVAGQSFGGTTAITLAAKNPSGVLAAVNFAGGGGGNPDTRPGSPCRDDLLKALFSGYGAAARIPTLWLYSENDRYFGAEKPREWFNAFLASGGIGRFVQLPGLAPPLGEDGHASFTRNPDAWRPAFEDFLRTNGF